MTRLIHVCGAARTGTTSVGLALGQGVRTFYSGEVHAYFRPFRQHHWSPQCSCGMSPCPVWSRMEGAKAADFVKKSADVLDVDFVVDSSGDPCWALDHHRWGAKPGYQIIDVYTYKEPLALAYSHWKRGRPVQRALDVFENHYGRLLNAELP